MRVAMLLHKSVEFDSRVRREASALARAGHEVIVLELAPVARGARLDGFERRSVLPPAWVRRALPFHLYRLVFLGGFVAGLLSVRPDVVHAHDAAMLLPAIVGARLTGAEIVYDSHELATGVPYRERTWTLFVAAIERLALPRCAAVITVSDGIAERLSERYSLRASPTVVRNVSDLHISARNVSDPRVSARNVSDPRVSARNGTPTCHALGLRERMGIDRDAPLVLHQGAAAPQRGCEVLVRAIARLPDVHLAFLGDPEPGYGALLRALIYELGVRDRVRLLPGVSLEQLLERTAEADVGVTLLQDTCENHRLALPNKLFEYIAARVPVLASALPEITRIVEGYGVGWCVAPDDPAALAHALSAALDHRGDPQLAQRLDRAALELCWSREQERLVGLYAGAALPANVP